MNPRKKSRPNTQAPADDSTGGDAPSDANVAHSPSGTPSASDILPDAPSTTSLAASTATASSATPPATPGTQTPKGRKWLSGSGSWRSKAPAIVKTAKESIGVTLGATGELPSEDARKPRDDSPKRFLTKRKSSKSVALPASITQVSVSSDGLVDETQTTKSEATLTESEATLSPSINEPPLPPEPSIPQTDAAANTWAWRSWWSRPDGYSEAGKPRSEAQESVENASSTPLPGPTPSEEPDISTKGLGNDTKGIPNGSQDVDMTEAPTGAVPDQDTEMQDAPAAIGKPSTRNTSSGSWFWMWSNAQNAQAQPPKSSSAKDDPVPKLDQIPEAATEASPETQAPQEATIPADATVPTETAQSTTSAGASKPKAWAFWYGGKSGNNPKAGDGTAHKHVGEVAVMDTPSQSHPEAAQFNEEEQPKTDPPKEPQSPPPKAEPIAKRSFRSLRGRPKAQPLPKDTPKTTPTPSEATTPPKTSPVLEPTRTDTALVAQPAPKQTHKPKQGPENLILPEFKTTYRLVQQPGFWKQVRQYFLGSEAATPHLHINPAPPRIRKAVAIGVHGFFPAPIIQKVLGQPTGTSIRFANAAAAAIKDWSEARGYSPEIEQIALEGEGFVAERVNALWKLLLNWIDHIKAADFILVACHSQGVPVAMMLVAKLIQFGCVSSTRIGVCAMAGVNMGPFIEYKTKYFGPTAAELFEFSNPKSLVSQMYLAALDEVLRFGVRIVYVGSIDDQLVSLEVSLLYFISTNTIDTI